MLINNDYKKFKKIIKEEYDNQEKSNVWISSDFEKINLLKNDYSGKTGERWVESLCKQYGIACKWNGDQIDSEATYDLIVNKLKNEVKTARQGKGKNFQHESLRSEGCDRFTFVDVTPNEVYITIISSDFDYTIKHPVLGVTPHLRKGTTDVYKFDLGLVSIKKGIDAGITIKITDKTPAKTIKDFLIKSF